MWLATNEIILSHGNDAVRLKPSLRAATRLLRKRSFGRLAEGVEVGNLTIISEIITEADDPALARRIFDRRLQHSVGSFLAEYREPLTEFLAGCFGVASEFEHPTERDENAGKPFDMKAALVEFFEIGTGWLGWSPADTWAATPVEIMVAQRGMIAKLKAIHGGTDSAPAYDPREPVSEAEVKAGISRLKDIARFGRAT